MLQELHSTWNAFKTARPGHRFERLYYRREARPTLWQRSTFLGLGLLLMLIGLVMLAAPGPGTVVFLLGAAVAAQESRRVARAMDRIEIRLWRLAGFARAWWRRASR